jgi:hypothetical protein
LQTHLAELASREAYARVSRNAHIMMIVRELAFFFREV